MIPGDIKYDPNATPPQYTNNEDTVIEPGAHVRCKIIGTRNEVGKMWAIGSIKEDYLGYVEWMWWFLLRVCVVLLTWFTFAALSKTKRRHRQSLAPDSCQHQGTDRKDGLTEIKDKSRADWVIWRLFRSVYFILFLSHTHTKTARHTKQKKNNMGLRASWHLVHGQLKYYFQSRKQYQSFEVNLALFYLITPVKRVLSSM